MFAVAPLLCQHSMKIEDLSVAKYALNQMLKWRNKSICSVTAYADISY